MKHIKTFESFLNEAIDSVTFSVNDEKLDQLLHSKHGKELDYVTIKGDEFYSLPKREFDRFMDTANSKGFGEESWSYYEESTNYMNEAKGESGLMVFGKTNLDNNKIGDWLDDSDYTAEWNAREGYWLFPEEEGNYDELEMELEKAFAKARINARFEGIF